MNPNRLADYRNPAKVQSPPVLLRGLPCASCGQPAQFWVPAHHKVRHTDPHLPNCYV